MRIGYPYPDRQRCKVCCSYFGFAVIRGEFCSWECADMPAPSLNPCDWPREHYWFNPHAGLREEKSCFFSLGEARESAARNRGKKPYLCSYCGMWHIGTPMEGEA